MPTHLLDTSVLCQPIKPKPLPAVERRWRALGDNTLATSVLCDAEIRYGLALKPSARLNALYEQVLKGRLQGLAVDAAVANTFSEIKAESRKKGFTTSDLDFLIAATAKTHCLILATLNVRHFKGIEGLAVEDWSAP